MSGRQIPYQLTKNQATCEVEDNFKGGYCEDRAEGRVGGLLLCERHTRMLEAQDKMDLLLGIISCLDLCLRNLALRRDANLVLLLRAKRAGAAEELDLVHTEFERLAM
jgi:hypothetical protein